MSGPTSETRRLVLRRDGWKCVICGRETGSAWSGDSIHHRLLRSQGAGYAGLHRPANLIALCGSGTTGCHGWVHAHPAAAYQAGYLVHMFEDPARMPLYYPRHGWQRLDDDGRRQPAQPPDGMPDYIPDIHHLKGTQS